MFFSLRKKLLHLKHRRTNHYSVFRWRNLNLLLDTKDYIARKILIGGGFESDLVAAIENRLRRFKPTIFVDVGANWGFYSCIAARHGVPEIHAFEPNPRLVSFQRANFAMNNFVDIIVHQYGLSDIDADDQDFLISPRSNSGLSKFGTQPMADWQRGRISVRRLDGALTHAGRDVMLKVDIEGAEQAFLAGAEKFLTRNRCDLFIEINEALQETASLLGALGYSKKQEFVDNNFWFANHQRPA